MCGPERPVDLGTSSRVFSIRGFAGSVATSMIQIRLDRSPPAQIHYEGDDWPDPNGNGDGEPQISPDGKTLYFDSSRSVPIDANRSPSQFLADVERLNTWDNGSSNVWSLPLQPLLDALGQRQKEKLTDAKK